MINTEIERKFLIEKPAVEELAALEGCVVTPILQTYLVNPDGYTERVRMREYPSGTAYYHTLKKRISSASAYENEEEISFDEYTALLNRADSQRIPISKTRCAIPYEGHTLEVDIYPFWHRQAVLEIELGSEDEAYSIPDYISVIREVTGNHAYSNNALSKTIPAEDI